MKNEIIDSYINEFMDDYETTEAFDQCDPMVGCPQELQFIPPKPYCWGYDE